MFCAQGHVQCRSAGAGASVVACTICANPTEVTLFSTGVLTVVKQRVRQLLAALTRRLDHGIPYGRCEGMHGSGQAPCWWSYLLVRSTGMLQRRCEPESAANAVPSGPHPTPAIFMHAGKRTCSFVDRAGSSNSDVTLNWSWWRSRSSSRTQVRYLCHRFRSISTLAAAAVDRHIAVQPASWTRGFRPFSRAVDRPAWRRGLVLVASTLQQGRGFPHGSSYIAQAHQQHQQQRQCVEPGGSLQLLADRPGSTNALRLSDDHRCFSPRCHALRRTRAPRLSCLRRLQRERGEAPISASSREQLQCDICVATALQAQQHRQHWRQHRHVRPGPGACTSTPSAQPALHAFPWRLHYPKRVSTGTAATLALSSVHLGAWPETRA